MRLEAALATARERLRRAPFRPVPREATLLLGHVLDLGEARVLARLDDELPQQAERRFFELLERRLAGEPVAYLTGEREFYGREFVVDRRALIPRPETEHLVEAALARQLPAAPCLLEIGCGSGCIAVTLALELPTSRIVATDISPGALALTATNARRYGVTKRLALVGTDLVAGVDLTRFDLVISNPPYVGDHERSELSPEILEFEPERALLGGGARGLDLIDRMLRELRAAPSGVPVLLEVGAGQAEALEDTARFELRETIADYAGIPRVVVLRRT